MLVSFGVLCLIVCLFFFFFFHDMKLKEDLEVSHALSSLFPVRSYLHSVYVSLFFVFKKKSTHLIYLFVTQRMN